MTSHDASPTPPAANPFDPALIENPYPAYAELRQQTPVAYSPQMYGWLVTRYEDVRAVLLDPARFSSASNLKMRVPLTGEAAELLSDSGYQTRGWVNSDPPDHTRLRGLVNRVFTAQRIAALEPGLHTLADELIDRFIADGQADLIGQFALPFAATVIADLLGVPRERIGEFKRGADDWLALLSGVQDPAQQQVHARGFVALRELVSQLLAERRAAPRDDLLSALLRVQLDDGARLSEAELTMLPMHLLVAGHESSVQMIGNSLALLLAHPEQLQRLHERPALIASTVEEALRIEAPVPISARVTTGDVVLGGVSIPAGQRVYVLHAAANHDPALFAEPDRFDIQRANASQHLTFGRGIHACLGLSLARMEGSIALEHLLGRLPNLRLQPDQPPQRLPLPILRGYLRLPLAWDPPGQP